jgi:hypothetical protein
VSEHEEVVDIPEPEEAIPDVDGDTSAVDPGGDPPPQHDTKPGLGEDPAYDPGGMGRQPDIAEEEDDYGGP